MKSALALVTDSVIQSSLKPWLQSQCALGGMELEFHSVTQGCRRYVELFKDNPNVITWNCRMPHSWMTRWGNNVLFVENSLLAQGAGIFVDQGGFFSRSNLCQRQTWRERYPACVADFARSRFGWQPFSGGNPDGPILVALQCPKDCNVQFEFPASAGEADKVKATLRILRDHLPKGRRVLIRPHPRAMREWEESVQAYVTETWRDDFDVSAGGSFYELLPQCSALVTVNSTCASEALTLGLPVSTLGTGAFTGSNATLECALQPSRLAHLFDWRPAAEAAEAYTGAILGRHFLPYDGKAESNMEFNLWLEAAQ